MAALLGVDVDCTISITFVMGAALAAVRRHHVPDVLRGGEFLRRLRAGRQGFHGGRARRHRLAAGGGDRRAPDRPDRDAVVGLFLDRLQGRRGFLDSSPSRSSSCPRACSDGRMSRRSDMSAPAARAALRAAIMDAGLTAVLAFFLLLPLIGFRTVQNIRNEIVLETRWQMLFGFVAMAATGRLFYSLVIAPWRERRATQARPPAATVARPRPILARWFAPFCIGFVLVYPALSIGLAGFQGSVKWIDNFGIQILIYVMLGLGLNIVVGLAGLLDLGYVAFYAVGAYSYALLAKTFGFSFLHAAAARRLPGRLLGHPARLSGAAAARRLSGDRHPRVRRDHPAGADQLGRPHQRVCGHQRHSAPAIFRHSVHRRRRRLRGDLRARVQPALSHHLPLLSDPRPRAADRLRHHQAAPPADRARLEALREDEIACRSLRHQHHPTPS